MGHSPICLNKRATRNRNGRIYSFVERRWALAASLWRWANEGEWQDSSERRLQVSFYYQIPVHLLRGKQGMEWRFPPSYTSCSELRSIYLGVSTTIWNTKPKRTMTSPPEAVAEARLVRSGEHVKFAIIKARCKGPSCFSTHFIMHSPQRWVPASFLFFFLPNSTQTPAIEWVSRKSNPQNEVSKEAHLINRNPEERSQRRRGSDT